MEDQKPDAFIAGPLVRISARNLAKQGVLVTISLPPKMVSKLQFEFSSVSSGVTCVLGKHLGRSVFIFELKLEELLNMQHRREFILDVGKLKLDVAKTLKFLNEQMRF